MTDLPYRNGDNISLSNSYIILQLLAEEEKYWMFEAIQSDSERKVLIKIFNNEAFLGIEELEDTWVKEIDKLQSDDEYRLQHGDYIESGMIPYEDKNLLVIVISVISDLEISAKMDKEESMFTELMKEMPKMRSSEFASKTEKLSQPIITEEKMEEMEVSKGEVKFLDDEIEALEDEMDEEFFEEASPPSLQPITSKPPPPPVGAASTPSFKRKESAEKKMSQPRFERKKEVEADEKEYMKHISMEYFDRMNPQNYYPMIIDISDIKQEKIASILNPITGERKVQHQESVEAILSNPIVKIKPTIPGCNVVPSEIETDFTEEKDTVTFYVTPGVKGKILGQIRFINDETIIHTTDFEAKVVDPNYARIVAFYGILASFLPKIISFLGVNFGLNLTLNDLWNVTGETFGSMNIASMIAIGGIVPVIIISFIVRQKLKPSSCKVLFKIADFRLKSLKPKKSS